MFALSVYRYVYDDIYVYLFMVPRRSTLRAPARLATGTCNVTATQTVMHTMTNEKAMCIAHVHSVSLGEEA